MNYSNLKFKNFISKLILMIKMKKFKNLSIGDNTFIDKSTKFRGNKKAKISIGKECYLDNVFACETEDSEIIVGDRTLINIKANITAKTKIHIGNDVMIGFNVTIYDTNAHSMDYKERQIDIKNKVYDIPEKNWDTVSSKPITIEDKVWIGFNSVILKGVTIGEGAIIGANSVVRNDVEPWTIVAGNPAVKAGTVKRDGQDER